jgi:hypothetical protein
MVDLRPGSDVGVPCEINPGPFPGEFLIIIRTSDESISGFVSSRDLRRETSSQGYVRARVVDVRENEIIVKLAGSFFTTTGIASFKPGWARDNLQQGIAA